MRSDYVKAEGRKRSLLSGGATAGIYLLAFLAFFISGLLRPELLDVGSKTVTIRLGNPEGSLETGTPTQTELSALHRPEEISAPESQPSSVSMPKQEEPATVEAPAKVEAPTKAESAKPVPKALPSAKEKPALPKEPSQEAAKTSNAAQSNNAVPAKAAPPSDGTGQSGAYAQVIRGSEEGNAMETSLEGGSGVIGRSLYVPIYLYLPTPYEVPDSVYDSIPDDSAGLARKAERQAEFAKYYRHEEGLWRLKAPIAEGNRPRVWIMLEDAGYPLSQADYKRGKYLRPVVLSFKVGTSASGAPRLEEIKLLKSSGYSDIDDAVIFGFKQAAFFNKGLKSVSGRFTYGFDNPGVD
jgi:outer membrane biosynthesis protein TonB